MKLSNKNKTNETNDNSSLNINTINNNIIKEDTKSNSSQKPQIYYYFYILRIISSFAVVLIHISADYYFLLNVRSYGFKIAFYYNGISRFGIPIFYMISGALFLSRDIPLNIIYSKYIKGIVIHLTIWSFIYSISSIQLSIKNLNKILLKFLSSHYHLWFLFSITGLYLLVPFLREIVRKYELYKIFLLQSFLFSVLFPSIIILLSLYSKNISNRLKGFLNKFDIQSFFSQTFYFMFGNYLNNYNKIQFYEILFVYIFGFFGIFFTTFIPYNISFKKNIKFTLFSPNYLNVTFYSVSIFILTKNIFINKKKIKLITIISKNTFGIYLVHPLIINLMKKLKIIESFKMKILFRIPLITSLIFITSLLISILFKYIPLIGPYIF